MTKNKILLFLPLLLLASCNGGANPSITPSSEVPSSQTPSSEAPSSESPSSEARSSEVPSSEERSSEAPSSELPSSETHSSEAHSSSEASSKLVDIDYVKVLCRKEQYSYTYAWIDGPTELVGGWPGVKMQSYDDNWYYYDFKNNSSFNLIFNDNNGHQTKNLFVDGNGYYFYYDDNLNKRDTLPKEEGDDVEDIKGTFDASLYRNTYQLLVYSFADSNGDGIGDFKGIADKLDYLKNLGIESIWLSPTCKAASYHAYDVTDYYAENPVYIVNGFDLSSLVNAAHNKGINILLDLVLNHTSDEHTWYKDHRSWYSNDNKFGSNMPELDFDQQVVRNEIINVGKYWLSKGVDGFRLDAAMWVYNDGSNRHQKNYEWWNTWCNAMREEKNNVYIVAEVLDSNHNFAYEYAKGGFTSTFDFNTMERVYNAVNGDTKYVKKTIVDTMKAKQYNSNYILGRNLSNHDIGRFSMVHSDMGDAKAYYYTSINEYRLASMLNILTPGNTYVYYGDELGLKGTCNGGWDDMSYRTPMPFESERTDSLNYFTNWSTGATTGKASTSTTMSGNSADQDAASSTSLYATYKALLNLKIAHPSLKYGAIEKVENNDYAYKIVGDETFVIEYNPTDSAKNVNINGTLLFNSSNNQGGSATNVTIARKGLILYKV